MSVEYIKRLAGPFIGDGSGQKVFTFGFLIFDEGDIFVSVAEEENALPRSLTLGEDFSVQMNDDQAATPGGTITLLDDGLAKGAVLAIGSSVPYTQTLTLTNYTRFPPERITKELDRIVVQIQQLKSESDRSVKTDETDTQTASELKQRLLEAADTAFIIATQKVEEAKQSAEAAAGSAKQAADSAKQSANTAANLPAQTASSIEEIKAAAQSESVIQAGRLQAEGDKQVARVTAAGDSQLWQDGLGCQEQTWTLTNAVKSGTAVAIPNGMKYMVGRHHLRLSWNGIVLFPAENFTEIGDEDAMSGQFACLFDMEAGDVLNAWTATLGAGAVSEAIATANAASDAVAELSRKVVYKDEASAS